jgi:hypothetical protein
MIKQTLITVWNILFEIGQARYNNRARGSSWDY